MPDTPPALLLFAHGSRDPAWRVPLDAVRDQVATQHPGPCVLGFLEFMSPSLDEALDDLASEGVGHIRVLPVFWASGKHVRQDLADALDRFGGRHPGVRVSVAPAMGEDPGLQEAMARWAMEQTR